MLWITFIIFIVSNTIETKRRGTYKLIFIRTKYAFTDILYFINKELTESKQKKIDFKIIYNYGFHTTMHVILIVFY